MDTMKERLSHALGKRGMKPRDLIDATGLSRGTIYFLLDGTTGADKVRATTVEAVCRALRIRREWLLSGIGPMSSSSEASSQAPPDSPRLSMQSDPWAAIETLRTTQLRAVQALAESIPTVGRALTVALEREQPESPDPDYLEVLLAALRRELAKQDAAALPAAKHKARGSTGRKDP